MIVKFFAICAAILLLASGCFSHRENDPEPTAEICEEIYASHPPHDFTELAKNVYEEVNLLFAQVVEFSDKIAYALDVESFVSFDEIDGLMETIIALYSENPAPDRPIEELIAEEMQFIEANRREMSELRAYLEEMRTQDLAMQNSLLQRLAEWDEDSATSKEFLEDFLERHEIIMYAGELLAQKIEIIAEIHRLYEEFIFTIIEALQQYG